MGTSRVQARLYGRTSRAAIVLAAMALVIGFGAPTWGKATQQGHATGSGTAVGGVGAILTADTYFSPNSGACVLQAVAMEGIKPSGSTAQLELGYARCSGTQLDGTCGSGQRYFELLVGTSIRDCTELGNFSNGVGHYFEVSRDQADPDYMQAFMDGNRVGYEAGFSDSTNAGRVMMEYTRGDSTNFTCSGWGPLSATFTNWLKEQGGVWANANGGKFAQSDAGVPSNCFNVGDLQGLDSHFTVTK